jgi:hypothetical protein
MGMTLKFHPLYGTFYFDMEVCPFPIGYILVVTEEVNPSVYVGGVWAYNGSTTMTIIS